MHERCIAPPACGSAFCTNADSCHHSEPSILKCCLSGSAKSPVAATLFHNEVHTLATTAGKIIVYTLATTSNTARSSGSQAGALTGNGKAPVLHEGEDSVDDPVLSQLEQLVDLLEQYFHPSNFGRCVLCCAALCSAALPPLLALLLCTVQVTGHSPPLQLCN